MTGKAAMVAGLALGLMGLGSLPALAQAPADNPMQLTSDHVTISVADIDKEQAWYERVLGFKELRPSRRDGAEQHRSLTLPGVYRIDLAQVKGSVRHTVGLPSDMEQGWRHIVFVTPDAERALQMLRARGVEVNARRNPRTNAITEMFMLDPEGNEIEIQQRAP